MSCRLVLAAISLPLLLVCPALAAALGQVDTFTGGTVLGWSEGSPSPNPPTVISTGGPGGAGDKFLRDISTGGGGAGSKLVTFNDAQWTGSYAGITAISADMEVIAGSSLSMRLAIENTGGTQFGSTSALSLAADGQWHHLVFPLDSAHMSLISGGATLSTVLSNVSELRIMSAVAGPTFNGDPIAATLGVDNIAAVPEPSLGLVAVLGALLLRRQKHATR